MRGLRTVVGGEGSGSLVGRSLKIVVVCCLPLSMESLISIKGEDGFIFADCLLEVVDVDAV